MWLLLEAPDSIALRCSKKYIVIITAKYAFTKIDKVSVPEIKALQFVPQW
jgi:hypothetical protein